MKERVPSAIYEYHGGAPQSKREWQPTSGEIDLVREYLKEIGERPLLTREKEKSTAETIEMGTAAHLFLQALSTLIPNSNIQNGEYIDTFLSFGGAQEFIDLWNVNGSVKPIISKSSDENEST